MDNLLNAIINELGSKESQIAFTSIAILVFSIKILPWIIAVITKRRGKMKKISLILLSIAILSGCTMWVKSHTEIVKDQKGEVASSKYIRDAQGLSWNDPETAESWAYADQIARTTQIDSSGIQTEQYRFLSIRNTTSDYIVEILSEPFAGITLSPGEKTREKKAFPVGLYQLAFKWCKIESASCSNKKINISIDRRRTTPITITNK